MADFANISSPVLFTSFLSFFLFSYLLFFYLFSTLYCFFLFIIHLNLKLFRVLFSSYIEGSPVLHMYIIATCVHEHKLLYSIFELVCQIYDNFASRFAMMRHRINYSLLYSFHLLSHRRRRWGRLSGATAPHPNFCENSGKMLNFSGHLLKEK